MITLEENKNVERLRKAKTFRKKGAMTTSYLAFPAALSVETTESPDILAPVPWTRESNQINVIRLLCP